MLIATRVVAECTETINVTFKYFPKGSSYAENEKHDLGSGLVIYTTSCHFTEELRIYSSDTYNGYVVSDPLPGPITKMNFKMGYKQDVLNVYGSTDKENWTLVKGIGKTSTSYKDYTLDFPQEKEYTCFKLDVKGDQQIRIESMSVTYVKGDDNADDGSNEDNPEKDDENDKEEEIVVSAPIFNPTSTTFSTESLEVIMDSAEGCEIYYTKDGSIPSYSSAGEYNGTKGNIATIYASDSKVTLQAIAVNSATGKCSNVSSATYTYASVTNIGSKDRSYSVADVRAMSPYGVTVKDKWVRGTICGAVDPNNGKLVTSNITIESNIAIGDENEFIAVELRKESNIRERVNLRHNPCMLGKEILVQGNLERYLIEAVGVKSPTGYEVFHDAPINSYGYATLYLDMPVSVPTGSTAYYCTVEGNQANLCPVGNVIPAGVGVVISSTTPNKICSLTYTTQVNSNEESIVADNQLIGFTQDTVVMGGDYAYYALNVKDNKLGFYIPQTATNEGFTAKANKSYLRVPKESEATMFFIHKKDETSIVSITQMCDDVIYDLQGRVVSSPVSGVYIIGGKKVVIK